MIQSKGNRHKSLQVVSPHLHANTKGKKTGLYQKKKKTESRDGTVRTKCWHSSFSERRAEGLKPARGSPQSSLHACEDVGLDHCLNVREAEAQRSAACQQTGGNAERMLISFALGLPELLHDAQVETLEELKLLQKSPRFHS